MTDDTSSRSKQRAKWVSWLPYILIPVIVYFGHVELQSFLGRRALANTGLEMLPLDDALAKAAKENKMVLADMSAIWCPTCRKLDQEVLSNEEVKAAITKKYVFSRIEYESEEGKIFMQKYQVSGFPTLLIINASGEKQRTLPIRFSPEEFIAHL